MKLIIFSLLLIIPFGIYAQQDTISTTTERIPAVDLSPSQMKQYQRQIRRDSIRANKKVWLSILGGPSYTPEASFGVGGALLASFRLNKYDTISQRSFVPVGFNLSLNGTFVVAGSGTFFFNENKYRLYIEYGFRNQPMDFFGVGFDEIKQAHESDSTTGFKRNNLNLSPKFVWEIKPNIYVGGMFDINYNRVWNVGTVLLENSYYAKYGKKYMNVGLGATLQYDSRDDVATPYTGLLVSATGRVYGKYLGGDYNYQIVELEYRQFKNVFKRRSTLAWTAKTEIGLNNVPYTELPGFGSPRDLRGYLRGKYRDKTMALGIVEYRHMFKSQEAYERGDILSKFGFAGWVGTATLGHTPADWDTWKYNYGAGIRIQIQPRKNFRFDVGREPGHKFFFYMNMTEAF
ncbi:MAG: BamA/TamA family outer membrane protein [Odoribacter sp.]|nr:BamA/TamA family outer membrane protein [Odoribacter sp.]